MPLNGKMVTIHRASALCGIPENTLRDRVNYLGMTLQEAVDTPYIPKGSPRYEYHGALMTKKQIAEAAGVDSSVLSGAMYRYGITAGEAADYLIASNSPITYNGETMTLFEFARSKKCRCYSAYIMIHKNGMTPEEVIAATETDFGGMTRLRAARMMCGEIFGNVTPDGVSFKQQSEELFTFGSDLYRYEVRFFSDDKARLTAIYMHPEQGDITSSVWLYSINEHGIVRTGRVKA